MIGAPPKSAVAAQRAALEAARRRTALQVDTLAHAVVDMDDAVGWARLTELGTRSTVVAQESAVSATADLLNATLNAADLVGNIASLPGIQPGRLASGNDVRGMFAATRDIVARRMTTPDVTFPMALDASASKLVAIASSEPHRIGRDGQLAVGLSDDRFNRYRRVAVGNTCAFCLMLATRGAVYLTAASAGQSRKYHAHCDCYVELVVDQDAIARSQSLQGDWRNAIKDEQRLIDAGAMDGVTSDALVIPWQRAASGAPLARTEITRIASEIKPIEDFAPIRLSPQQVAQEIDRLRGNAYAYQRQIDWQEDFLARAKADLAREKAYLREQGVKPQSLRSDPTYRRLSQDVKSLEERLQDSRRDLADALEGADFLERTGLTKSQYAAAKDAWERAGQIIEYRDDLGVIRVNEAHVQRVLPGTDNAVDVRYAVQLTRENLYEALDQLPENVREHVMRRGYRVAVDSDAESVGAAAFTYAGASWRTGPGLIVNVNPRWVSSTSSRRIQTGTTSVGGDFAHIAGMSDGAETLVHEIGHMVDRLTTDEAEELFNRVLAVAGDSDTELVSGYGRTKARELVAEVFVRWVRGDTDEVVRMVAMAQRWALL